MSWNVEGLVGTITIQGEHRRRPLGRSLSGSRISTHDAATQTDELVAHLRTGWVELGETLGVRSCRLVDHRTGRSTQAPFDYLEESPAETVDVGRRGRTRSGLAA